jgi:hypothetical protein
MMSNEHQTISSSEVSSVCLKAPSRLHPHAVLNQHQAVEVYRIRKSKTELGVWPRATAVSKLYGVSPKTIRDIWNRRTWIEQTKYMWADNEHRHLVISKSSSPKIVQPSSNQAIFPKATYQLHASKSSVESSTIIGIEAMLDQPHDPFAHFMVSRTPHGLLSPRNMTKPLSANLSSDFKAATDALRIWKVASTNDAVANDPFHADWPHW